MPCFMEYFISLGQISSTWGRFCFCVTAYNFKALIARGFQFTSFGFLIPSIRFGPMQVRHVYYNSNYIWIFKCVCTQFQSTWNWVWKHLDTLIIWIIINMPNLLGFNCMLGIKKFMLRNKKIACYGHWKKKSTLMLMKSTPC